MHGAVDVDAEHAVPLLVRDLGEVGAAVRAGVVHQAVEVLAVLGEQLVDQPVTRATRPVMSRSLVVTSTPPVGRSCRPVGRAADRGTGHGRGRASTQERPGPAGPGRSGTAVLRSL